MPEPDVTNNPAASQFEFSTGGKLAFLQYKLRPGRLALLHTEVPKELEGHGIGGKLARAGLEFARAQGLVVVPLCPFVVEYIKRHPEFVELVAAEHRARVSTETGRAS
ncbi:MAG TPA: GNAT family N-acetyltransferase [Bryobacteraceae bacterium]|nr:GNAT family N-acetyltransferase [Bryobacteraceae bacterium]